MTTKKKCYQGYKVFLCWNLYFGTATDIEVEPWWTAADIGTLMNCCRQRNSDELLQTSEPWWTAADGGTLMNCCRQQNPDELLQTGEPWWTAADGGTPMKDHKEKEPHKTMGWSFVKDTVTWNCDNWFLTSSQQSKSYQGWIERQRDKLSIRGSTFGGVYVPCICSHVRWSYCRQFRSVLLCPMFVKCYLLPFMVL